MLYVMMLLMFLVGTPALFAADSPAYPTVLSKGFFQYDAGVAGFTENDFGVRRVRTDFVGKLSSQVDYRIQSDYAGGSASLLDAYVNIALTSNQWLRLGKTKSPIGFELLQLPTNVLMPEFGFSTYLVPNRDTGIQWISKTKDLELNLGVFAGAADSGSVNTDSDKSRSLAGRAFFWPIRGDVQSLGLGVGGNVESKWGTSTNTALGAYSYRGYGKLFAYTAGVYANGAGYRIVPQVYFVHGPIALFGEYAVSSQEISNGTLTNKLDNKAWQLTLQYVATGETATYANLIPATPFGVDGGLGALQLGLRMGELDFDDASFIAYAPTSEATKVQQLGASANWIWNTSLQWTLGVDQIKRFNDNGTESSDVVALIRAQVTF